MYEEIEVALEDLTGKVDALRDEVYRIVDALGQGTRRGQAATYIVDRLDLVKETIRDVQAMAKVVDLPSYDGPADEAPAGSPE